MHLIRCRCNILGDTIGVVALSFRHNTFLLRRTVSKFKFHCSLIEPIFLGTFELETELLKISAGSTYHNKDGVIIDVESVVEHPCYKSSSIDYDFSIIKLKHYSQLPLNITLKLPAHGDETNSKDDAWVTGWGATLSSSHETDEQLRGVSVPVISTNECRNWLPDITDRMICAGLPDGGE